MLSQSGNYSLHIIVVFVVLVAAVMWLPFGVLSSASIFLRIVCIIVGLLAILVLLNRDVYLPFMASTVLPSVFLSSPNQINTDVIQEMRPEEVSIKIDNLPPLTKVFYWAAESEDPRQPALINSAKDAYGNYTNSGTTISNKDGIAIAVLKCPQKYNTNKIIYPFVHHRHLHYRYTLGHGMLSRVFTHKIRCGV
jgi:hypothetical protein